MRGEILFRPVAAALMAASLLGSCAVDSETSLRSTCSDIAGSPDADYPLPEMRADLSDDSVVRAATVNIMTEDGVGGTAGLYWKETDGNNVLPDDPNSPESVRTSGKLVLRTIFHVLAPTVQSGRVQIHFPGYGDWHISGCDLLESSTINAGNNTIETNGGDYGVAVESISEIALPEGLEGDLLELVGSGAITPLMSVPPWTRGFEHDRLARLGYHLVVARSDLEEPDSYFLRSDVFRPNARELYINQAVGDANTCQGESGAPIVIENGTGDVLPFALGVTRALIDNEGLHPDIRGQREDSDCGEEFVGMTYNPKPDN